jgi:hypothetical protein
MHQNRFYRKGLPHKRNNGFKKIVFRYPKQIDFLNPFVVANGIFIYMVIINQYVGDDFQIDGKSQKNLKHIYCDIYSCDLQNRYLVGFNSLSIKFH